ncbi:ISAs1 family transposase [Fimbriiglobus ruber]|nr:ISAs1 family transposase [Fimbriiglobus ruber]
MTTPLAPKTTPLATVFTDVPDPRQQTKNTKHQLTDILVIATCAVLAGAQTWEAIALYGRTKETFFRTFLALPNGIPSHDTFYNVFRALDPDAFATRFGAWMAAACRATGLIPIAIDGKSVRGTKKATATGCLHTVSAWATANRVTLGQVSVPDGSNEIAVMPELLRVLELKGALVTIDAAGCQVENARIIRDREGDYLLTVKGNQPTLLAAVEDVFASACATDFAGVKYDQHATSEKGHGRHDERYVTVIYDPKGIPDVWQGVKAVVQVNRERTVDGKTTHTTHYYLSSYAGAAAMMAGVIRGHWGIENPQPDDWRSNNLCEVGGTGYDRTRGPSGAGRVVRPAPRPRRHPMSDNDPVLGPPVASPSGGDLGATPARAPAATPATPRRPTRPANSDRCAPTTGGAS